MVEAFAGLAASDYAEVILIAVEDPTPVQLPLAWRAYASLDGMLFRPRRAADDRLPVTSHVSHKRAMAVRQCDVRWLGEVAALDLDVAFAFGSFDDYALKGLVRYGSWRFFFGDEQQTLDRWAGFSEAAQGEPVTTTGLKVRYGPGAAERVVYQSWSRTHPYSMAKHRENLLRKSARFASRALRELHRGGTSWLESCPVAPRQTRLPGVPQAAALMDCMSRMGGRLAMRAAQRFSQIEQWCLAWRFDAGLRWQDELPEFQRALPPSDRFWADPFAIERDGRYYIFFEELLFARGKAHIAVMEVKRDGSHTPPRTVLSRDYHLSYPFLLEEGGVLYMVPETGENRTVELYRCVRFPDEWALERVLLRDAWCVDASFHRQDGRWWMFVNIGVEGAEIYDELHLYSADTLAGEWLPHPGNPVRSDVRGARPAGRPYVRDGVLYRPAQICAPLYGSGIAIHKVVELNDRRYREEECERIMPGAGSGLLGLHTLNRAGALTVIDGFIRRSRIQPGRLRGLRDRLAALTGMPASRGEAGAGGAAT